MSATLTQHAASRQPTGRSTTTLWIGRVLSTLIVLFLAMDATMHLLVVAPAVQGSLPIGYIAAQLPIIGAIEAALLIVFLVPRTAPIGAVLWTGYFGAAVAAHFRVGDPLFKDVLAPTYFAAVMWVGLYLRDPRVRAFLLPLPPRR